MTWRVYRERQRGRRDYLPGAHATADEAQLALRAAWVAEARAVADKARRAGLERWDAPERSFIVEELDA